MQTSWTKEMNTIGFKGGVSLCLVELEGRRGEIGQEMTTVQVVCFMGRDGMGRPRVG